jgi:hypothetical protein
MEGKEGAIGKGLDKKQSALLAAWSYDDERREEEGGIRCWEKVLMREKKKRWWRKKKGMEELFLFPCLTTKPSMDWMGWIFG